MIFAALASIVLGAVGAIGQTNIKRLLAYSSINNVGFALIGLAARHRRRRRFGAVLHGGLYRDDARQLPRRAADARRGGRPVESDRRPVRPVADAARRWRCALAMFMFSLAGMPPLMGFWAKLWCSRRRSNAGLTWLAAIGIAASVIGAFYYLKIVKMMYFDEPAPAYPPAQRHGRRRVLLIARRRCSSRRSATSSIGPLARVAANAAAALFLVA